MEKGEKMKEIKRRKDCFLGVHTDFHACPEEGLVIGETLREEDIRKICEELKPDYWQIDCKGHPGWASYPTRMGNAMPKFKGDPLKIWRKVTKEYAVALYMHFSGVYDVKYCKEHPEEATLTADGKLTDYVRLDGKYLDTFFIPQISELVEEYDIDGIWIDGDCWAVRPDYHEETLKKFEEETGISLNGAKPAKREDPYYFEYFDFTREQFRKYLKHYVDVLHKKYPSLQICSNWAFDEHMPEKLCADVDFLSGDLGSFDCVSAARSAGRMFAQHEKPWDMMSWSCRFSSYGTKLKHPKHYNQLLQEASVVISLGGSYQYVVSQFKDGSPNTETLLRLKPVMEFLRAREPYSFKGKIIHQAVVLVSGRDRYREIKCPFSREGIDKQRGLISLLCDSGISVEVFCDENLSGRYSDFPMIVLPERHTPIEDDIIKELEEYVRNGGSLLITGSENAIKLAPVFSYEASYFAEIAQLPNFVNCNIGHDDVSDFETSMPCYFFLPGEEVGVTYGACEVKAENAVCYGNVSNNSRTPKKTFAQVFSYGKGKVGVIGANFGTQYNEGAQYLHRKLIRSMADALYTPLAKVEVAVGTLEIVCLEKDGKLMLQLVNVNGAHNNYRSLTEEYIPPVLDAKLSICVKNGIEKLILQPDGKEVPFDIKDGRAYFEIERIDMHNVIEVCFS